METINGKYYPLWSQFVERKNEWIGGKLVETDDGITAETIITDIKLTPNGKESAFFSIVGKDFTFGFDVSCGGVGGDAPAGSIGLVSIYGGNAIIYQKQ